MTKMERLMQAIKLVKELAQDVNEENDRDFEIANIMIYPFKDDVSSIYFSDGWPNGWPYNVEGRGARNTVKTVTIDGIKLWSEEANADAKLAV